MPKQSLARNRGVAYIELALMLPMLLFLICVSLEFASNLRLQQRLVVFSREAANSAFRRCAENTTIAEVASCLQVVNGEITTQGNAILPGLNLILSVYRLEPSGCDLSAGACSDPPMSAINPLVADQVIPIKTRYELSDFAIGGKYNQLLNENRVIAISEVFFNYEPLIPVIGQIFYPGGTLLYDTTLF